MLFPARCAFGSVFRVTSGTWVVADEQWLQNVATELVLNVGLLVVLVSLDNETVNNFVISWILNLVHSDCNGSFVTAILSEDTLQSDQAGHFTHSAFVCVLTELSDHLAWGCRALDHVQLRGVRDLNAASCGHRVHWSEAQRVSCKSTVFQSALRN